MSKSKGWFGILLFSFFFVLRCYGQSYQTQHYSELDGLLDAHVYDITQDHRGRMWFATRREISCYDGFPWESYRMSDNLPARAYVKISVDRKG